VSAITVGARSARGRRRELAVRLLAVRLLAVRLARVVSARVVSARRLPGDSPYIIAFASALNIR
jgi:hypothetical protein